MDKWTGPQKSSPKAAQAPDEVPRVPSGTWAQSSPAKMAIRYDPSLRVNQNPIEAELEVEKCGKDSYFENVSISAAVC